MNTCWEGHDFSHFSVVHKSRGKWLGVRPYGGQLYRQRHFIEGLTNIGLFNLSRNILHLDLLSNHLQGSIPEAFQHMVSLRYLSLPFNELKRGIPKFFRNMCSLNYITLAFQLSHWTALGVDSKSIQGMHGEFTGGPEFLWQWNHGANIWSWRIFNLESIVSWRKSIKWNYKQKPQ